MTNGHITIGLDHGRNGKPFVIQGGTTDNQRCINREDGALAWGKNRSDRKSFINRYDEVKILTSESGGKANHCLSELAVEDWLPRHFNDQGDMFSSLGDCADVAMAVLAAAGCYKFVWSGRYCTSGFFITPSSVIAYANDVANAVGKLNPQSGDEHSSLI